MPWKIVLWVRAASSCRLYAYNSAQVSRLGVRSVKTPGRGAPMSHSTRAADYDCEPYTWTSATLSTDGSGDSPVV
jgi:hypothetical protein